MKVSIIIPCYNEEKRIVKTLNHIEDYIKSKKHQFEIIVVDDGSKDNTVKVVNESRIKVRIIKFEKNKGKGCAIKAGMAASCGDISLFMDADSSTEISEFDKLMPHFKDYDVVIGSRALSKDSVIIPQGFFRRNLGFIAHKLIHLILKTKIKDTTCGFKAFSKDAKNLLFTKQIINGWGFDYELIFLAEKFGFKIKEVPIKWKNNFESKVTVKGYLKSLNELFMIRLNELRGMYC